MSIEDARGRLQAAGDAAVTRVIVNNRAGAPVEQVRLLIEKLDGAYFANHLYLKRAPAFEMKGNFVKVPKKPAKNT